MSINAVLAGLIPTGGGEWVLILLVVLLLFGSTKLPALARGLGEAKREFKRASREDEEAAAKPELKKPDATGSHGTN
ncbi:MAG TPA: twin-arginine translocase TatA/TatE family subunit [Opitutaceae bacterium]|jgi:sec-independent protein translocase protein TatA